MLHCFLQACADGVCFFKQTLLLLALRRSRRLEALTGSSSVVSRRDIASRVSLALTCTAAGAHTARPPLYPFSTRSLDARAGSSLLYRFDLCHALLCPYVRDVTVRDFVEIIFRSTWVSGLSFRRRSSREPLRPWKRRPVTGT